MKLYCDMDGVLVDFHKGLTFVVNTYLKIPEDKIRHKLRKEQVREIKKALGRDYIKTDELDMKSPPVRWLGLSLITKEMHFWKNLDWMPEGRFLWDSIKEYNPIILSSPLRSDKSTRYRDGCIKQKETWCKEKLNLSGNDRVIIEENKSLYAKDENGRPNLLIDDTDIKLRLWKEAGGIPIPYKNNNAEVISLVDRYMRDNSGMERLKELSGV
jgi:hypothetical protein